MNNKILGNEKNSEPIQEKPWIHIIQNGALKSLAELTDNATNGYGANTFQIFEYYYNIFAHATVLTEYQYYLNEETPSIIIHQLGAYTDIGYLASRCMNWIHYRAKHYIDSFFDSFGNSTTVDKFKEYFIAYSHDDGFSIKQIKRIYDDEGMLIKNITCAEIRCSMVDLNQANNASGYDDKLITFSKDLKQWYN